MKTGGAGKNTGGDVENTVGGGWCNLVVMKIRALDRVQGFKLRTMAMRSRAFTGDARKSSPLHSA